MEVSEYIDRISSRYRTGISTEHSYRGDLQNLLETLVPDVMVTNEPERIACGAPDYIITRKNIPVGYIEAKDIGVDLTNKAYKEQFDRYRTSLGNLIITDYTEFKLFRDGTFVLPVRIGEVHGNKVIPRSENFGAFTDLIKDFCTHQGQTIKSASKLSKMMALKARLMADVIEKALTIGYSTDQVNEQLNLNLHSQYDTFKQYLIHDITEKGFADIYAQTIAYGMFAARLNDASLVDFSRFEAAELIPKSNPFLRNLFQYIASYNLDDRIKWMVDELADIFRATNVSELLKDFGKSTQQRDPIIHFYETFLSEYDPKLRKSRGVWYTPEPVVNFIVRAVDDILKDEFGLSQGLADTSKIKVKVPGQGGKPLEKEAHRVQILDPAAGTGTFLAEVIKQVHQKFAGQQGIWNQYVDDHLIPRLNGFEILMASYAMAHLKLDMLLKETGYKPTKDQRLRVYLTNSLEEHHPDTGTLFANWLSSEANQANHVKRDTPVMCVIGNPPYSVSSSNKSKWIKKLIADYKKGLNERNIQPLSDDYIKFIRFGQHYIDKNGCGILAYVSNNSFIDGLIHRQLRKKLLESFDKIYILDLHGNYKKKEKCVDGTLDQNVFDIMQGVSINIFVKKGSKKKNEFGSVFHKGLLGVREFKYDFLSHNSISSTKWKELDINFPNYFFVIKDYINQETYENGFKIDESFIHYNTGLATELDDLAIQDSRQEAEVLLDDLHHSAVSEIISKYNLNDKKISKIENAIKDVHIHKPIITSIDYRPFDIKYTIYTGVSNGLMGRPREGIMKHMLKSNLALLTCRQQSTFDFQHVFISNTISERCSVSLQTGEVNYIFPLYLYPDIITEMSMEESNERKPNLSPEIINQFVDRLGLTFTNEKENNEGTFAPIDILDYTYAVLHSPTYREKYKVFLKIDFPRVPYPKNADVFLRLIKLGREIRQIHLLESPVVDKPITCYPVAGSNELGKITYADSKVWINPNQYFDGVSTVAWEFYIGGYQPAQKWLKDRKGRVLSFDDIMHYQKIIVALTETDRLMKEIDLVDFM